MKKQILTLIIAGLMFGQAEANKDFPGYFGCFTSIEQELPVYEQPQSLTPAKNPKMMGSNPPAGEGSVDSGSGEAAKTVTERACAFFAEHLPAFKTAGIVAAAVLAEPIITKGVRSAQRVWTGPTAGDRERVRYNAQHPGVGLVSELTKRRLYTAALTGMACHGAFGVDKYIEQFTPDFVAPCLVATGAAIVAEPLIVKPLQSLHSFWSGPSSERTRPVRTDRRAIQPGHANHIVEQYVQVNVLNDGNPQPVHNQWTTQIHNLIGPSELTKRRIYTAGLVAAGYYALVQE